MKNLEKFASTKKYEYSMWALLGIAMLVAWSYTVHNWTLEHSAKHSPCEVTNSKCEHPPNNQSAG